jgi:hypothetical protein
VWASCSAIFLPKRTHARQNTGESLNPFSLPGDLFMKPTKRASDVFGPGDHITEDRILQAGWDPSDLFSNETLERPVLYGGNVLFKVRAEIRVPRLYR